MGHGGHMINLLDQQADSNADSNPLGRSVRPPRSSRTIIRLIGTTVDYRGPFAWAYGPEGRYSSEVHNDRSAVRASVKKATNGYRAEFGTISDPRTECLAVIADGRGRASARQRRELRAAAEGRRGTE